MTRPHHEQLLAYAAQRAKARPEYLACVLARYVELERISEEELAQHLGITAGDLLHLALCLRPRVDHFAADVRQISTKFGINPAALATVVHLVDSVEVLAARDAGDASTDAGLLMAARARKHPPGLDGHERRDHDDHPRS
jgi:hypothetical protein